jgi:hypothetical protein
VADLDQSLPFQ